MSDARLSERVILVIGGTSGLGLSAVKALLRHGAKVIFTGKNADEVAAVASQLGSNALGVAADATDPASSEMAVERAVQAFGRVDGLYHVAGGSGRAKGDGSLHEVTDEGWHFTLELNLSSVFYSNRAVIRRFLAQASSGTILNMASVLASSPSPGFFATHAYAAAKAGVIGMSRAAAARYAAQNIRVNVVAPGLVETPMSQRALNDPDIMEFVRSKQPLDGGRAGSPSDLDDAVVYFLSDASRFVTGQVLALDGGWSVSDGRDRRL